jgi:hypothetical protein
VNYNRSLPPIATQFSKANFLGYQIWFSLISQEVCYEYKRHSTIEKVMQIKETVLGGHKQLTGTIFF